MKITKSQLKQIIKEELSAVLNETEAPANMIATIANYFVEIGEYDNIDIARDMVLTMSDDNISKMYPIAQDYFSKQGGSP